MFIEDDRRLLSVEVGNAVRTYSFEEVKHVSKVVTAVAGRRRNPKPRWGDFYYFDIEMKSGEELIITSLMTFDAALEIGEVSSQVDAWGVGWVPIRGRRILNLEMRKGGSTSNGSRHFTRTKT